MNVTAEHQIARNIQQDYRVASRQRQGTSATEQPGT
jgi:hypothetical protein